MTTSSFKRITSNLVVNSYLLVVVGLFLYSYTQVDLNLTLSQISAWQTIQKSFQYIGWFQRPLSTALFLVLLLLLVTCYVILLRFIHQSKLPVRQFWQLVIPMSAILLFSYNAFSYDLFNYMFDARIVTYHHTDPYAYKALDFPDDPWINFMRWTHRTYPYGAVWLWLTVPLSFVGMQFFLPTLFLFKGLMVGAFLGTVYFIGKILEKLAPDKKLFGMAAFALNPLVIIESLVSAHNDIVMMLFATAGLYAFVKRRHVLAIIGFLLSACIKFINDPLPDMYHVVIPLAIVFFVFGFWLFVKPDKEINWDVLLWGAGVLMVAAMFFASQRTELQPWYLLWVLPFVALLVKRKELVITSAIVSLGLLLHYVPFLYTGNWDPPIPTIKFWITALSITAGTLFLLVRRASRLKFW